jgi:hypothetical protein
MSLRLGTVECLPIGKRSQAVRAVLAAPVNGGQKLAQEHRLQFQGWNGELTGASSTIAKRPSGCLVRVGA